MHPQTVYAKTSKGVLDFKNKSAKVDRSSGAMFMAVDGKSTVAELVAKSKLDRKDVESILDALTEAGYIKVFSAPAERPAAKPAAPAAAPQSAPPAAADEGEMDLDFTSPEAVAQVNAEAEARKQKEAQAKGQDRQQETAEIVNLINIR